MQLKPGSVGVVGFLALAACSRPGAAPAPVESAAPPPSASAPAEAVDSPRASAEPRVVAASLALPARQVERRLLKTLRDEKNLAAVTALVTRHFDGGVPSPLEVQSLTLPAGHRAVLTFSPTPPAFPFLAVTTEDGSIAWSKERPLAGTRQVVTEMLLTPGPDSELAMLWCDIPTQVVGLRRWAPDGVPLADFEVLEVDLCSALSGLYWPTRGWVAVASHHGPARAQLLDERGSRRWGPKGIELPWTARPVAPVAIAVDGDASLIVLQVADRPRAGELVPDRLLAMRYDADGHALWDAPIDLGDAGAVKPGARVDASPVGGKVRVALGKRRWTLTSKGEIDEMRP